MLNCALTNPLNAIRSMNPKTAHCYQMPTILITPANFVLIYCSIVQPFSYFEAKASSEEVLEMQTIFISEKTKALQPNSTILTSVELHFNLQLRTLISAETFEKESMKITLTQNLLYNDIPFQSHAA